MSMMHPEYRENKNAADLKTQWFRSTTLNTPTVTYTANNLGMEGKK